MDTKHITAAAAYLATIKSAYPRHAQLEGVGPVPAWKKPSACRICKKDMVAGDIVATYEVRKAGKSRDEDIAVHAECAVEKTATPAASAPMVAATEAPVQAAAAAVKTSQKGAWCRRCHGPVSDGSGFCGEC